MQPRLDVSVSGKRRSGSISGEKLGWAKVQKNALRRSKVDAPCHISLIGRSLRENLPTLHNRSSFSNWLVRFLGVRTRLDGNIGE